jgi:hypothetical protein
VAFLVGQTLKEETMKTSRTWRSLAVAGAMLLALNAMAAAAAANETSAEGCARQFDEAQRIDMESFRDFDEQTFWDGHDPRAITVFAQGQIRYPLTAIQAALAGHFAARNAVWSWTELYRVVDGCKSAFILYDATYEIPSIGFSASASLELGLLPITFSYSRCVTS